LVEVLVDEEFRDLFADERKKVEDRIADEELYDTDYRAWVEKHEEEIRSDNRIYRRGYRLGIDSLIIVDPVYVFANYRIRNPFNLKKTIEGEIELLETLDKCIDHLDMRCEVLSPNQFKTGQTGKFNALSTLNEWFDEGLTHGDKQVMAVNDVITAQMADSLGASHALWLMVIKYKRFHPGVRFGSILAVMIPPFIPAGIYSIFVPRQYIKTMGILYDLRTGEEVAGFYRVQNHNSNPGAITSSLYDVLWQINAAE
jgi:hypothetical protein